MFGRHYHESDDPWREAPDWAIEMREMQLAMFAVTMAKLNEAAPAKLSPEDQATVNALYDKLMSSVKKLDTALSAREPEPGGSPG